MAHGESRGMSRRALLGGAVGAAALSAVQWTPAARLTPAGGATMAAPPNFPAGVTLYQQVFENWSGEIEVDGVWTAAPTGADQIVVLADWAHANGWRIRPRGMSHNWSPLVVPAGAPGNVLLVDTTRHLTAVTVNPGSPASVTAQAGVTMESLLTVLEAAGYGLTATPAPGDLTIGGVLAIDGHGTAVPKTGETTTPGHTFGSVSNLVVQLKAVVWDAAAGRYAVKVFRRSDPAAAALLVGLGRTFVTEVTLRVGADKRLRCQSFYHIGVETMFAPPASAGPDSFAAHVNRTGRVEVIWFPFTTVPWLKVWSVSPSKPLLSKQVNAPYNYPFSDFLSEEASDQLSRIVAGEASLTPAFENTQMAIVGSGLIVTGSWDIWGWSKNTLLYVRPTTLRVTANGYAILTARNNVQRVVSEFYTYYRNALNAYAAQGRYPMNGPLEIRVTGLDRPADVQVAGAVSPQLSALRPRPDHPEWDVAVWLDILTVPGTPYSQRFYRETEQWILGNYTGSYAAVRPEWSKGWAYSGSAAWADAHIRDTVVPGAYRAGRPAGDDWDAAVATLDALDPHRVFSNAFLDGLLG
ncbi:FAD/FMN-containing dehydrogenase [Streptosporangium becharense]|uniref:FAD/FMN-containing dehydrogenase n=1 Tax=Streptosporangium becharense TaxID=1816182 RepID=A0A7W9IL45_9ACTN|nr:cholesterol oxidase substrate-binding domain-containing protein [Streptosporangium becharense]MBB2911505.1 FAD/FMN-containing dehydrogenase [Streptosporangium becharense]MBB5822677.1 FAD/FMN-containing dehydrogenase [Streptosporangium becharense]